MEQRENQLNQRKFCCSICLDLLKDPVTIPCGHSYCMNCIKSFWDEDEQRGIHSCPQCRKTFTRRPDLEKNIMLAELLEDLKKTGLQAAPADHCYAGPRDVACDFCTERKLKAIKSCLVCLASYCEKHLQPHYDSEIFKKHKLVEPNKNLQENICPKHDEVMKMFCRTDQKCICYLCSVDEHQGHDTVSAAAERTERQRELEERRGNIQQRIQDREKDVKEQKEKVVFINHSADISVEVCEKIFIELINLIQKIRLEVKNDIKSKQEDNIRYYKNILNGLEQEITELKKKDAELKQLLDTEDDIQFLNNFIPETKLSTQTSYLRFLQCSGVWCFNDIKAAVPEAEIMVCEIVNNRSMKISLKEINSEASSSSTPTEGLMDRDELLKFSQQLTLDSKTANRYLSVTRKRVIQECTEQFKDDNDRFEYCFQVLSKGSLNRRSYWEVKGSGRFTVAVAHKDIREEGVWNHRFGLNKNSWALDCFKLMYVFRHNRTLTLISAPRSSTIGVYLDHRAGTLSFYSVPEISYFHRTQFDASRTMTLLHRIQTTFTQPLHAGIRLYKTGNYAEFCQLK